ncbi:MAG: rane-associated lipoprotein involved in thiamine biosynthesis [Eubacterium sp.]|nr:rane-associated lipoprotein involved in thiamine biosynthesis [Eubacterium sp.]
MGTVITERVYGDNAEAVTEKILNRMHEIEDNLSINIRTSSISQMNSGSKGSIYSEEVIKILETAKRYSALSNGAFDVTIGPLVKEWGVFTEHPRVPAKQRIDELLGLVDYKSIDINKKENTAKLTKAGQLVDLGGIAKGYAADEAVNVCIQNDVKSAYINLGGNVSVLGSKPDGSPWKIGLQNPRGLEGEYIGILNIANKTVVTSGDYERYFVKDGIRYHHIIDPKTGYPSKSDLISSTIVTDKSIEADALSTATFVLGLEKSKRLISGLQGVEAVFVTKDKKVYVTDNLKKYFTFKDESGEYTYVEKG